MKTYLSIFFLNIIFSPLLFAASVYEHYQGSVTYIYDPSSIADEDIFMGASLDLWIYRDDSLLGYTTHTDGSIEYKPATEHSGSNGGGYNYAYSYAELISANFTTGNSSSYGDSTIDSYNYYRSYSGCDASECSAGWNVYLDNWLRRINLAGLWVSGFMGGDCTPAGTPMGSPRPGSV